MKGYIYVCEFKGKYYVGESVNALKSYYLGTGKKWKETIKGHTKEVKKTILETIEADNRKDLKKKMHERGIYWIDIYDSTNPDKGYNISPGGNIFTEESLELMKKHDSETMKRIMATTDVPQRISKTLSEYRRKNGFSEEHKQKISKSLKDRRVGGNPQARSIPVYCIKDKQKHTFINKITAAKWWYDNYPFSENYSEITYTRMITKSINNETMYYKGKPITNTIKWYEDTRKDKK